MNALERQMFNQIARLGVQQRIAELRAEAARLYAMFPDLRQEPITPPPPSEKTIAPIKVKRRKGWTRAQRDQARRRMRKYWRIRKAKHTK